MIGALLVEVCIPAPDFWNLPYTMHYAPYTYYIPYTLHPVIYIYIHIYPVLGALILGYSHFASAEFLLGRGDLELL